MLAELAVLAVLGFICAFMKRTAGVLQAVLAITLFVGITASFIIAVSGGGNTASADPAFVPDGDPMMQIMGIIAFTP